VVAKPNRTLRLQISQDMAASVTTEPLRTLFRFHSSGSAPHHPRTATRRVAVHATAALAHSASSGLPMPSLDAVPASSAGGKAGIGRAGRHPASCPGVFRTTNSQQVAARTSETEDWTQRSLLQNGTLQRSGCLDPRHRSDQESGDRMLRLSATCNHRPTSALRASAIG